MKHGRSSPQFSSGHDYHPSGIPLTRAHSLITASIRHQPASPGSPGILEIDNQHNVVFYHGDEVVESPNDIIIAPQPTDSRLGSRDPGLTCDEASMCAIGLPICLRVIFISVFIPYRLLSHAAKAALDNVTRHVWSNVPRTFRLTHLSAPARIAQIHFCRSAGCRTFLLRVDLAIICVHLTFLLLSLFLVPEAGPSMQSIFAEHVTELSIISVLVLWNATLYYAQVEAPARQVVGRAKASVKLLERVGLNTVQEIKIPSLPSAPIIKVIRDGIIRSLPSVLLVKGDVIELHFGDIAPAKCRYVYVTKSPPTLSTPLRPEYTLDSGQGFRPSLFSVPPSTLMQLEGQLNHGRYQFQLLETPIRKVLDGLATARPTPVMTNQLLRLQTVLHRFLLLMYFLSIVVSLLRHFVLDHANWMQALIWTHAVVLPLYPLMVPTLYLVFRSFSNAHIAVLWQELQISKTDYEDVDQDEFDFDAPPPTKNVTLAKFDVLAKALQIDTSDLTESLGSITVLCFVDREGTLTEAFPSVDQIWLPTTLLDVGNSPNGRYTFEDRDWQDHLPLLRPLSLTWLMLTHCDLGKYVPHRNLCGLHIYSHTKASRQTCLCPLAREIGLTHPPKHLVPVTEIFTFAPYHSSLDPKSLDTNDHAAQALNRANNDTPNPMSLSNLLALHRNGAGTPLCSPNSSAIEYDPYHAPADESGSNVARNLADDEFEVPFLHSVVLYDNVSQHHQMVSVGSVESVLDVCTDAWLGDNSLAPLTHEQELALIEWYCNTTMNDHQVLAHAYRPILEPISCLPGNTSHIYLELPFPTLQPPPSLSQPTNMTCAPGSPTLTIPSATPAKSDEPAESLWHEIDLPNGPDQSPSPPATEILALIQNQIFLGMTAFAHEPKEDVCDAVEDVALAGIRFVYFSPTNERQTKAFGERLGLDTDWNSCILLSKSSDPHASPMYMERTDIKARLPRGVDAIRQHLLEVDDIPLHVSLFAESSPTTVAGMVRVFQEHGEIVCAMGSTLNSANVEIFYAADLAVGVEPVPIKATAPHSYHIPPLALGSKLISLPCPLVMHPETSLYAFTQLLKTARQLCRAARQAFTLIVATCLTLTITQFLVLVSMLPPWRSWLLMWIAYFTVPVLGVTYANNPHEVDTMKEFTERNLGHVCDLHRFLRYFGCRFVVPIVLSVWLYGMALATTLPDDIPWTGVFGYSEASLQAEIIGCDCLLLYIFVSSITMLHRTRPFWEFRPFENRPFCCVLVTLFLLNMSVTVWLAMPVIVKLPWYVYVVVVGSVPFQLVIHEKVKSWDRRQWIRFQKRSKLEFNTRLGMHSPI